MPEGLPLEATPGAVFGVQGINPGLLYAKRVLQSLELPRWLMADTIYTSTQTSKWSTHWLCQLNLLPQPKALARSLNTYNSVQFTSRLCLFLLYMGLPEIVANKQTFLKQAGVVVPTDMAPSTE